MSGSLVRVTRDNVEATASGIYGIIVSSAVLVASHAEKAWQVDVAVLITLTVYWAAERYARIVAERIHEGRHPTWHTVRLHLTTGWEMVTASFLPLLLLLAVRLAGASLVVAELAALGCCTLLLCVAGWRMGSNGRLTPAERVLSTVTAGAFGGVMVLFKALLH